jgi:hypothetical protein
MYKRTTSLDSDKQDQGKGIKEALSNTVKKKWVRYNEGAILYSMGIHSFMDLAKAAKATYHVKGIVLVNTEKVDEYMELMCADDPSDE